MAIMLEFLNQEENIKKEAIKIFIEGFNYDNYNNRFSKFDITKKEIIEWEEIENWVAILNDKIKDKNYCGIYGVPRGGLIIATLLSYKSKLPLLLSPVKNCLVVDDDMTTGVTLLQYCGRYDTALMFKNPKCKIQPTYLYAEYDKIYKEFVWNRSDNDSSDRF